MKKTDLFGNLFKFVSVTCIIGLGLMAIIDCTGAQYRWIADPAEKRNDYFETKLTPVITDTGCNSFDLQIKNNTDKDIELVWDKTLYLSNGRTSGGFMFEGVVFKDRNNPKPPDIIVQNSVFLKRIYPNNLVKLIVGRWGYWQHENMPVGENGVHLTVEIEGVEIHEKITTNITAQKK